MKVSIICLIILMQTHLASPQSKIKVSTGRVSAIQTMPLLKSTTIEDTQYAGWNTVFQSLPNEEAERLFHVEEVKKLKMQEKITSAENYPLQEKRTRGNMPIIGKSFKGNDLKSWTPSDNAIAVSNNGNIVSCINYGIEYYDTSGGPFLVSQTWNAFINDSTLTSAKFDPRVLYDNLHDRFIIVLLHGFSSAQSKILVCYSKTNNPLNGWNIYALPGNPFSDTSWTDYPTIGVSDEELFINGNRFGDASIGYPYKGTYIYQIGLQEGYTGNPLQFVTWDSIYTPNSLEGITLYPAMQGQGKSLQEKMYFVQLMPDSGSNVYLYEINGLHSSPTKTLTASQYAIPHYDVCANAFQKDPNSGFVDSLSTGSAWTQNAFYLNKVVHFTFDANISSGWCGLHYGRIYLDSNKAVVTSFGEAGTDLCYPAVASFGYDSTDHSAVIAYVRSDTVVAKMPEVGVIAIDNDMQWSTKQTVKVGDTSVNILYPPTYAIQPERWGDYTGICRRYTANSPEAWLAAAFGANTPPRLNSFGNWIAQIKNTDFPVHLPEANKKIQRVVYPNPITDMFTLEFENKQEGWVSIYIMDIQGRRITTLFEDYLRNSNNRIAFNKQMLTSGNYFLLVERNKQILFNEKISIR